MTNAVYFIQSSEGPPDHALLQIKIGRTANGVSGRSAGMVKSQLVRRPMFNRILAAVRADGSAESFLLDYFSSLKMEAGVREVHHPVDPLVSYIRWLRDQWYVWVDDDPLCPPLDDLDEVPFDLWCPSVGRHKPAPYLGMLLSPPDDPLLMPSREVTSDDYYTNAEILDAARMCMGGFDLDPASHAAANRTVRAGTIYTKNDNGLLQPWFGKVWLNPPFSSWSEWSDKALDELQKGRVLELCAYAANRTISAKYFNPFMEAADACCNIRGRKRHGGMAEIREQDSPNDGHTIFYFGASRERFMKAFQGLGKVWYTPTPPAARRGET